MLSMARNVVEKPGKSITVAIFLVLWWFTPLFFFTTNPPITSLKKFLRSSTMMSNHQQNKNSIESEEPVPRYNGPAPNEMNERQKEIRDYILQTRPTTGLSGPFGPWLAVPEIAEPATHLGRACRYGTSLPMRESELVILLTGAKAKSSTEFQIHIGEALKAGIDRAVIDAVPHGDDFSIQVVNEKFLPLLDNDREKAIVAFTAELLQTSTVSKETYEKTKAAVDNKDSVLVEITSIVGYYIFVAYTLNVFRIPFK